MGISIDCIAVVWLCGISILEAESMRYSEHEQHLMDQESGEEADRRAVTMSTRVDARNLLSADECPECGSHEVVGGPVTIEGRVAIQGCDCNNCGKYFEAEYVLSAIRTEATG